jgi:hypothetical protein
MNPEQKKLLRELSQLGEVILISNGNRIHLDDEAKIPLKTQADAILYFLQRLDIEMIDMILDENRTYQDFEKSLFIKKLGYALDKFSQKGNTYLNRDEGYCNSESCNFKCKGFSFIGNKSGHYFDLIVDVKDGAVLDIYECNSFECSNNNEGKLYKIYIDFLPF